jgi:hypothetical protein
MEFPRKALQEDRRRRVLRDDLSARTVGQAASAAERPADPIEVRPYTDAALANVQPRVTDLIPCRGLSLSIFFLTGLAIIAGITALFACSSTWWHWADRAALRGLHLTGNGSIASWFSSLALACTTVFCVLVYNIRRHKTDDYRGRYSLWLWAAAGSGLASVDASAGIHRPLQSALVALSGTTLLGDGSIWWIACWFVVFGLLGLRVMLDVRLSRATSLALILASMLYVGGTLFHLKVLWLIDDAVTEMAHGAVLMLGHWMLAFSTLLYARHIYRVAQGELPASREKPAAAKRHWRLFRRAVKSPAGGDAPRRHTRAAERAAVAKTTTAIDHQSVKKETKAVAEADVRPDHQTPPPAASPSGKYAKEDHGDDQSTQITEEPEIEDRADDDNPKLSKAERRRLRKQQRRQRRAA